MLSSRGSVNASQLDVPWRFAPGAKGRYDPLTNPSGTISFATAENFLVHDELEKFVNQHAQFPADAFTYSYSTAGGARFPNALAEHLNENFNPFRPVSGDIITVTDGCTALHEMLGFSLADPGDGILVSRPCYGRFEIDFGNKAGLKIVYADTQPETCFDQGVAEDFEKSLTKAQDAGIKIRALLIINPHNPLGRCYPRETIVSLMQFCQKHQIHFISDEVYAMSVFDSGEQGIFPFTSALSIDAQGIINNDLLHVTYGLAKDFASAGLRIGALISRNTSLHAALRSIVRFHNPSGPSIAIATALLEDREWCRSFTDLSRLRISQSYQFVIKGLSGLGIEYLKGSNAGFFIWINLSPYLPPVEKYRSDQDREFALAQRVLDEGTFLHPGEEHALKLGWFRVVYTQNAETVAEGLKRLKVAITNPGW